MTIEEIALVTSAINDIEGITIMISGVDKKINTEPLMDALTGLMDTMEEIVEGLSEDEVEELYEILDGFEYEDEEDGDDGE